MTSRVALAIEATDYQFSVPFPYLSNTNVTVAFNRLIKRQGLDYYWRDSANIEFYHPPGKGVLEIIRRTPVDKALVSFHNGSVLTQDELNLATLQALYATEETRDYYDALINGSLDALVLQSGAEEAGPVIDKVIEQILSSEELKELQGTIADIALNARTILATQVDLESTNAHLGSLQDTIDALTAPDGGVAMLIQKETDARVEGDTALIDTIDLIGAKSGDGTGFIANTSTLRVSPDETLAERFEAIQTQIKDGDNTSTAAVASEAQTRTDADSALGKRVDSVQANLTKAQGDLEESIAAAVATEATARSDADGALGSRIDTVTAAYKAADTTVTKNVTALVNTEATTRANADAAAAKRLDVIEADYATTDAVNGKITQVSAQVTAEAQARSDADAAVTSTFNQQLSTYKSDAEDYADGVGKASNTYAQGLVQSEATTRANAISAAATRMDGLQATIGDNKALFDSEVQTRADGDSANASAISTLQTRVGNNESSIQQTASVANGLAANYMLKTDVNGYVAGFGLWNDGATSTFNILADHFAIVSPGYPGIVPFAVDANGVYMNNAYIRNLTVDKITGGSINAEWALNSTNGRIVLDTGAFMKVLGVGFGVFGDLIEWFGPKMAISQCSKSNATTYVGTDGSAYFGGSLSAGKLYNAAHSTSTAGDAYVVVGPFSSNGKAKNVVVTYSYSITEVNQVMNNQGFTDPGPCTCTVALYRTLNGGGEVEIARQSGSGGWSILNERDGPDTADGGVGVSFTFVDNAGATQNMTYVARVIALGIPTPGGVSPTSIRITANLSVVSTEE